MGLSKKRPLTPSTEIKKRISSKEEEKLSVLFKQILKKIRNFTIRERYISFEFEKLPDPQLHPLYREMIKNPISLSCMEKKVLKNSYHTPEEFAQDFLEMCKNAKTYNRAGSTIYKDANRLYSTFTGYLKEAFPNVSELEGCDSDEDEEVAWSRDLRERSSLAWQERNEYQEAQRKYARQRAIYFSRKENIAFEKEKKQLLETELQVKASNSNFLEEVNKKHEKSYYNNHNECRFCEYVKKSNNNTLQQEVLKQMGLHSPAIPPPSTPINNNKNSKKTTQVEKQVVITPSFRLININNDNNEEHNNKNNNSNHHRTISQKKKHPVTGPKKFKL